MPFVGILSDTHGMLLPGVADFLSAVDEIWHAGDIGSMKVAEELQQIRPLRAVYGNIDGQELRASFPASTFFEIAGVKVLMTHIGGYPGRYEPGALKLIQQYRPALFVCGHSHILKVIYDQKFGMLTINPGAAGKYGFHHKITAIRLVIDGTMKNLEVLEKSREIV